MVLEITFRKLVVKTYQSKTFDVIFNKSRGINGTIIILVQKGAEYFFY